MVTIDATTVKNRFGETLDRTRSEPVLVTKSGRKVAVILSLEDYEHLQAFEDQYWSERAKQAEQSGYIGVDESAAFLKSLL